MSYVTYTKVGPFVDGGSPGIDHIFLNNIEAMLAAGWFDSAITSNGSGVLTLLGLVLNGPLNLQYPASAQTLSNNSTITIPGPIIVVTSSANVTGIIMTAGSSTGQVVLVYNSGNFSVTFAASGSRVRNGSNIAIGNGQLCVMLWDGANWAPTI